MTDNSTASDPSPPFSLTKLTLGLITVAILQAALYHLNDLTEAGWGGAAAEFVVIGFTMVGGVALLVFVWFAVRRIFRRPS